MLTNSAQPSFINVSKYSPELLRVVEGMVQVPVTYKRVWDDGFGARGWKVDATIGDPEIIASTRETGQRINTSVFIHDILDHFLSGFGVSGHRSEAMALIQLSKRTGSDPGSDYEQLVREDVLNGRVNGEALIDFLPADLSALVPDSSAMTGKQVMACLREKIGENHLIDLLVNHFFSLGHVGESHAEDSWRVLGLDANKRTQFGLAMQSLLRVIDQSVEESGVEELHGVININNQQVCFDVSAADRGISTATESTISEAIDGYCVDVAA